MLIALLLTSAATEAPLITAVEIEQAFARRAELTGQWTAFREFVAPDAVLFTPQPVNALAFLRPLTDPSVSVRWGPSASFVSCDGKRAANTGWSQWPDGGVGYFSTVWVRQADGGFRWSVDHGDLLATARPRPARPVTRTAPCTSSAPAMRFPAVPAGVATGRGTSPDRSLAWAWRVERDGARLFQVWLWNGRIMEEVITDRVSAPSP